MYLIWTQIHWSIFNLAHCIRRKISTLNTEETLFETNMKLHNMRFENIYFYEGVSQSEESHNKRLLLVKNFGERVLTNNLLEYLYTAEIVSYQFGYLRAKMVKKKIIFTNLRWKRKKYVVLLLPFFVLLVSNCTTLFHS